MRCPWWPRWSQPRAPGPAPNWPNRRPAWPATRLDRKIVGPSYKDVAAKYAGQKDAAAMLAEKIIKGGVGVWGPVPMPANPKVSPAEAMKLAQWVLSAK